MEITYKLSRTGLERLKAEDIQNENASGGAHGPLTQCRSHLQGRASANGGDRRATKVNVRSLCLSTGGS